STATNLDPAGVAGTHGQIYVRQWKDAPYTTQLVSISNGASPVEGNSNSYSPSISYDGSRIAFATQSTNLDTTATMSGYQIWVRDYSLPTPATILVSRANDGTPANAHCELPAISGDGHWVAFDTGATNMADGDTDAKSDVHLRGIDAGTTTLISKSTGGTIGNQASVQASVNKDGTKVAFLSWATNFDTVADTNSLADIYVRDLTGATTTLVSR